MKSLIFTSAVGRYIAPAVLAAAGFFGALGTSSVASAAEVDHDHIVIHDVGGIDRQLGKGGGEPARKHYGRSAGADHGRDGRGARFGHDGRREGERRGDHDRGFDRDRDGSRNR